MALYLVDRKKVSAFAVVALLSGAPLGVAGGSSRLGHFSVVDDFQQAPVSISAAAQNQQGTAQQDPNPQSQESAIERPTVPSRPPLILFKGGELSIVAENSLLSEVVSGLRTALGAEVDLPEGVASERIWVHLGPGSAKNVLQALFGSTEMNYVIQASETDEKGIRSVLLTLRSKSAEPSAPDSQLARGARQRALPTVSETPEQAPPPEPVVTAEAAPEGPPSPPAVVPVSTNGLRPVSGVPVAPVALSFTPSAGSSQQMIQQLQSMYELRRQMQQQNQKPPSNN
jgi:hypothetical protein